jgi:hypothetical protein
MHDEGRKIKLKSEFMDWLKTDNVLYKEFFRISVTGGNVLGIIISNVTKGNLICIRGVNISYQR